MVLNDFQRGKLPFYMLPPGCEKSKIEEKENEEFINKMLSEQESLKARQDNQGEEEGAEKTEEIGGEEEEEEGGEAEVSVLEKTISESKAVFKSAQKLAEKKSKLKAAEKKNKIGELKGKGLQKTKLEKLDKKKLKNWNMNKK